MDKKYREIKGIVEKELSCSAHDIDHVMRVYNLCEHLARGEAGIDLEVLRMAALLHDIARVKEDGDSTGSTDHAVLGADMAERILQELGYDAEFISKVKHCIITHRFRSGRRPETMEAKILFDADKLDIIGAVGVARSFIIAGEYGERIFSDVPLEEYIKTNLVGGESSGRVKEVSEHAANLEFELKLKYIPEKLHTLKAKEIAKKRIKLMTVFFERLEEEIKGES